MFALDTKANYLFMKKTLFLNWMLVALIAFGFSACDNEPLEGEFVFDEDVTAEEGQFIATVDGTSFNAASANAIYNPNLNSFTIAGTNANGAVIVLSIENPGVGTFDLAQVGSGINAGVYYTASEIANPYITTSVSGGAGVLEITTFDEGEMLVSGNFSFTGVRIQLDANGDPVLDGSGNPVIESKPITDGSFNAIPFIVDTTGDGGGGGGDDPTDPADNFYAEVDGDEFIDTEIVVNTTTVGNVPMINIMATTATGAMMRIDIPQGIGTGTFDLASISDGTELIALYNGNTGGENITSNPGTITITEYGTVTGKLAATFSFTGTDPLNIDPTVVSVTNGSFYVDFIPDSGVIENSFMVNIDGVEYIPTSIEVTEEPFGETSIMYITTINADTNQSVTIGFGMDITSGTFEMSPIFEKGTEKVGIFNPNIGSSILFRSNPGILNVLSYELSTGVMEATFSFTAVDPLGNNPTTYEFTEGSFVIDLY